MKFTYRAINSNKEVVTGTLEGNTLREANRTLKKQGLTIVELEEAVAGRRSATRSKTIKKAELLLVLQQLQTLLASGVSLKEALDSLAETVDNGLLGDELQGVSKAIKHGESLSTALKQSSLPLPVYIHHLVAAGELTGALAESLAEGVGQMEYEHKIAGELKNALIYPVILVLSGIGAVGLIFTLVIPNFVNLLDNADSDLPFLAWAVLSVGKYMDENSGLVLLLLAVLGLVVYLALAQRRTRLLLWDKLLALPLVGDWLQEVEVSRWSAMLGTLLSSRVELTKALELAQEGVVSARLYANLSQVHKSVYGGKKLSDALEEGGILTATGFGLVRVGERSGKLPAMLKKMAELYSDSGRERMKRFLALLEPVAILTIGAFIGLIMAGVILAITSVNDMAI